MAYTILIIAIFRILPFKKNVFFAVYMTPMLILLAGSYSIDGMCVCLVGLFIAYCLKLYKSEQEIGTKQIIILAVLFALSLLAKAMSYAFICVLLLMLPVTKIIKQNKKTMSIVVVAMIAIVLLLAKTILFDTGSDSITDPRNANTDAKGQIEFMINNPVSDVEIVITHTVNTLLNFEWLRYINPIEFFGKASKLLALQLAFILYVAISDNSIKFKVKEKTILVIAFFATFLTGSLMLYIGFTPVGKIGIDGYQTRYIFPILPLLLMIVNNNNQETDENNREKISIILVIFMIIELIGSISRL